jgi:tetratricopeptide (TPR) repeat protein
MSRKSIGIALGGLLVLGLLGYAAYWYRSERSAQQHLQAARAALERRDFAQASKLLATCLATWPSDPAICLLVAQTLRRQGEFSAASEQLRQCPRSEAVDRERSLLRLQRGDLAEADYMLAYCADRPSAPETPLILEATITGSLAVLPPTHEFQSIEQASGQRSLPALRQGIALWLRLATTPADEAQGLVWRGRGRWLVGEYTGAVADFRRALELNPDLVEARQELADAITESSPREAVGHLQWLHDRDPSNKAVSFGLANLRRSLGDLEKARELLDALLADNPDDISPLVERGILALDMNQLDDAEKRLRRALTLQPNLADAHRALSRCLQAAGKTDEAKTHHDQFLRLEAQNRARPR